MSDFYGDHAAQYAIQNQLGQHAQDINEIRVNGWKTQTLAFQGLDRAEQGKKNDDIQRDVESDITSAAKVYKTGTAVGKATTAGLTGFARGLQQAAAGVGKGEQVTAEAAILGSGKVFTSAGVSGTASALARGGRGALATLTDAGKGSKLFATERFGAEGVTAIKDMTGVEGIVAKTLVKGGGEAFARIGAKGVGLLGTGIAVTGDVENLLDTGNVFNTKDAAGNVVKQNLGVDIGNVASIVGGALDVAAAFTGGALAPIAAAVNIFAAADSAIAGYEQDAAEKKVDEQNAPASKPPPAVAPQAFAQFGLVASQSHDPIRHILGG
jgi:hypothetical protein